MLGSGIRTCGVEMLGDFVGNHTFGKCAFQRCLSGLIREECHGCGFSALG